MIDLQKRDEGLRYYYRGLALEQANRMPEAVEAYRQAVTIYPHLREAHAALGFYYQRAGLLAKAVDQFQMVVSLEGDFLAYFNLGYVLIELERYEEALRAFEQCLLLEPHDAATHYEIAYIKATFHRDFAGALQHLQYPLASYADDWEVHNLHGQCLLGLRRYDEARTAFGHALMLAATASAEVQTELIENIEAVERYREFRALNTVKDQMYANEGVVYIGSAQDNGLAVTETHDYHFTYPDIGTTLQRLMALIRGSEWHFTALTAADLIARPLVLALGTVLNIPVRTIEELQADDVVLLVLAVGREAELLQVASEHMPCKSVSFCMGLNWLRHSRLLPEIVGIVAHGACSVPWEAELRRLRADGASSRVLQQSIDYATARLLDALHEVPRERNLSRQVRYYTRTHRRLSFDPGQTHGYSSPSHS